MPPYQIHLVNTYKALSRQESRLPSSPEDKEHVSEEQHQSPKWTELRGIPHSLHTEFQNTVNSLWHWYNSSGLSNSFWLQEIAEFLQKVKYRCYVTLNQVRESLKLVCCLNIEFHSVKNVSWELSFWWLELIINDWKRLKVHCQSLHWQNSNSLLLVPRNTLTALPT